MTSQNKQAPLKVRSPLLTALCITTAILMTTAGCSHEDSGQGPSAGQRHPRKATDTTDLKFNPIVMPTEPVKDETCPLFPEATVLAVYGPNHRIDHFSTKTEERQELSCGFSTKRDSGVHSPLGRLTAISATNPRLLITKRERTGLNVPVKPTNELFKTFSNTYPGVGFEDRRGTFWWTCGNLELTVVESYSRDDPHRQQTQRDLERDHLLAMQAAIRSLCGTFQKPSTHVTNWPHIVWDRYDAYGGTEPTAYGINRPTDAALPPFPPA